MNDNRLKRLKTNASLPQYREAMHLLYKETEEGLAISYRIGPDERGDWGHYYYCHHDGASLTFDWTLPKLHQCPVCEAEWKGEPFDSAWTTLAHARIGRATYHASLRHIIRPDEALLAFVRANMLDYAHYYEGYGIHGDIPYNGPGKLFAQTLDEAHWILDLAAAFDYVREDLTIKEQAHIRDGLFAPCARFLIAHKEKQIHNHSVLITTAISSIGLLLGDDDIVREGLEGKFGLYDQIDRGVFADGLWYEGNAAYHFYAFKSLLNYALLAEGTPWELWNHAAIPAMFDFPLNLIQPDGSMPSLNDGGPRDGIGIYAPFYEIALNIYGKEEYRSLLNTAYGTEWADGAFVDFMPVRRSSVYALLCGEELGPSGLLLEKAHRNVSFKDSGLTKLANTLGWQMLIKHSKFGGEHDHMDRLGLSVIREGVPLLIDPGTTAYGIPAHYGWFKHTYSHNTICLNGADQPPRDGRVIQFEEQPWGAWAETEVDWLGDDYAMKDRIDLPPELCPWDEEVYRDATYRRINVLADDYVLDLVRVEVPLEREVSLNTHISGLMLPGAEAEWRETDDELSLLDQRWLKEKRKRAVPNNVSSWFGLSTGKLQLLSWCSRSSEMYTALTPDNPPVKDRTSVIHRTLAEGCIVFAHAYVYETDKLPKQWEMSVTEGPKGADSGITVRLETLEQKHTYAIKFNQDGARMQRIEG